jgi:voltage-gated potassium channel
MPKVTKEIKPEKINIFQIVILVLSFYVLISMLIQLAFKLPLQIKNLLDIFDFLICMIFLYDFFYRLFTSSNKLQFLKWGWIDFVSSIPTIDILRWGRFFRIFKILHLLRAFKSTKTLVAFFYRNRAKGSFAAATIISFLLVTFASVAILSFENLPSANIHSAVDAVWWAFSTISTTGSGDKYPVTSAGKILSVILAACGIGLFGTFTAYVARYFLEPGKNEDKDEIAELRKELGIIKSSLQKIADEKTQIANKTNSDCFKNEI